MLHVANALAELDAAGIRLYCDREGIDSSTPMGRAMIQMASVFGEQERSMLRSRVLAGLERVRQQGKKLGRPKVSPKVENAIRTHLSAGNGILKVAALVGCREWHRAAGQEGDGGELVEAADVRPIDGRRSSCIKRQLKHQPAANQHECHRQDWSQHGVRHTGGEITADDYARRRTDEQRCQQWPIDRAEEPVAHASNQGQRYGMCNVGPDDDCHRQRWIE